MSGPNRLGLNQVALQKRGTGDGKNIVIEVFDGQGNSYELTIAGNLKRVSKQPVRPGVETAIFPDAGTRAGIKPAFRGQIGIQLSDGTFYYGTDVVEGAWTLVTGTSVLSVFGRIGAVIAQAGDYSESQIANLRWRPPVTNLVDLPLAGNTVNDIRLVTAIGTMYRWNGAAWVLALTILGTLEFQGVWNASTNAPALVSGVGTKGFYFVVNVAGTTPLDGITDWNIGDWAIFNGTAWQKIDNSESPESSFVFRPGVAPNKPNVYDVWGNLYTDLQKRGGKKVIVFDDAGVGLGNPIPVPAGTYDMTDVEWHGIWDGPHLNTGGSLVYLADGVVLTNLCLLDNSIRVYTESTTVSPITIPAAGFDTLRMLHGSFIAAGASGGTKSFVNLGTGSNYWLYLEGTSVLPGSVPTFEFGAGTGHLHVQMLQDVSFFNGNSVRGTNPAAQVTAETTAIDTAIDRVQPSYAGVFTIKDVRLSMMDTWVLADGASDPLAAGVLSSWEDLMDALALYQNDRNVNVEIREKNTVVPAGSYNLSGVRFVAREGLSFTREVTLNDAQLFRLESHGFIHWINKNTTVSAILAPTPVIFSPVRIHLRSGSKLLQHVTGSQTFLQVATGATVFLDLGDDCLVDQNGGAVEAISNDGSLEIYARDNAQVTNGTITATVNVLGHMIGPASYISTNQTNAPFPLLTVDRSTPRLDWDYLEVTSNQAPTVDELDKVVCFKTGGSVMFYDLPSAAICKNRRATVKVIDEFTFPGGTVQIRPLPGSDETIEGFRNPYIISTPGQPSITLLSDGVSDWKIVSTSDLHEQAVVQELLIAGVGGFTRYYTNVGSMFLDAATETNLDIDTGGGFVPAVYGVDYTNQTRGFGRPGPPASVLDSAIGFLLAVPSAGGEVYRFRWVERKILRSPDSVMAVRFGGSATPDYSLRWNISLAALVITGKPTDGIQVPLPKGYALELWRLSKRRGGDAAIAPGGAGRRYVPYLRGATDDPYMDLSLLIPIKHRKEHYKVCLYNALTGARSALCSETILHMSNPKTDDNLNSNGDAKQTRSRGGSVWIL